ncbi:MAG TPA: hypothetical protein VNA17_08115 [Pyrinomonadaceae bacterium]|nr:hypothetical protein [Pyrinomonadaceae bacterium]
MFDETLIPILEEGLQKTRDVQRRLIAKLQEAEAEVEYLRLEIAALEESAVQTEKTINRYSVASRTGNHPIRFPNTLCLDDEAGSPDGGAVYDRASDKSSGDAPVVRGDSKIAYLHQNRVIPSISSHNEPVSKRFSDRTIIQACTLLLRESNRPLHVNELYNLLISGGMKFNGRNPTISVAVSLSRSPRFRKVDRGTFELDNREGLRVAS